MPEHKQQLVQGQYFHIYNRGNNGIDLFYDADSYYYFLKLYDKYIEPIAETYAWCLMKNHFHILVYLKIDTQIDKSKLEYSTVEKAKIITASKQFSHFFNAYTQSINKRFKRTGSLFEKPFERKIITSDNYLQKVIFYIHNNPVHHGFTEHIWNYPWSSYESILSEKPTKIKRKEVIDLFQNKNGFLEFHNIEQDLNDVSNLLID